MRFQGDLMSVHAELRARCEIDAQVVLHINSPRLSSRLDAKVYYSQKKPNLQHRRFTALFDPAIGVVIGDPPT